MTSVIITRKICVHPKHLDCNIMSYLLFKIKKISTGEITKEHGYILDIIRVVDIITTYISNANSDIIFVVKYEAIALNPQIGNTYNCNVCMISTCGIFADINGKIKVLIPLSNIKNYVLDETHQIYSNGDKEIKNNDNIEVKITATKFNKKMLNIIGTLI